MAIAVAIARKSAVSTPEIIIPAYGCPDLVAAIMAQGGKPVLADLLPETPHMDDSEVGAAVTENTVAVVAAGFLGIAERLDLLSQICREKGVFLIEDSAQCFPPASAEYPWADFVVLSFGRGKPINLMGGGALLVRTELYDGAIQVIEQFPVLKASIGFGWRCKRMLFHALMARFPYLIIEKLPLLRIGETRFKECSAVNRLAFSEALLSAGIREFFARPLVHPHYDQELETLERDGWKRLGLRSSLTTSYQGANPHIRYGLLAPTRHLRDRAEVALNYSGIGASSFYREILPDIEGLQNICGHGNFPAAREFASRLLTLPCHEDVKRDDVLKVSRLLQGLSDGSIN